MAVKHVATLGFGFASGVSFIPTLGFGAFDEPEPEEEAPQEQADDFGEWVRVDDMLMQAKRRWRRRDEDALIAMGVM